MSVPNLLRDLNLSDTLLEDPEALIDMEDCWRIIVANQNAIHEESLLLSSRPLKRGTTRLVFSNLTHCENLEQGLETLAETYNIVHGGNYNFVRKRGNHLSYIVDDSDFHYQITPNIFAIEFALLKIHCALSCLTGRQLKLVKMATKRPHLPDHPNHHLHLLDCKLLAAQPRYELVYDVAQAKLPFQVQPHGDIAGNIYADYVALLAAPQTDVEQDRFIQQVLNRIKHAALEGIRSQEMIADHFGMSVATLRRKLERQNITFRDLQDRVNSELAVNYLHDQMLATDVAEKLGYSDVRSFKRAFKRWYGMSPAMYIRQHQFTP
ncbi:AraC family transcriptional regulator [Aestuariicella hydrocarbonica]|uniref:AraC family transcriptional regulator n=1 Tax=Pseudomaricurvus hydrocarbonicus TaxID=1470433 RepID=A0A9E5MMY3_9GAMM|nr:AraC family transcriptional regulator [Aestuariicella hydrocarbonica]NHO67191.1 AraC family transcriptional regulator [Aestuariicella hydrocarbonica]